MKNVFILSFALLNFQVAISQANPVRNLEWNHFYDSDHYNNVFSLSWEEPESPHDELIGYNIYREDELYEFQPEYRGLICEPEYGIYDDCDFIFFGDDYGPFTGFVSAVYKDGIESEYVEFYVEGPAINTQEVDFKKLEIYPNPVQDILYFETKAFDVSIFDFSGKKLKSSTEAESIFVGNLPKGNYLLFFRNFDGKLFKQRFVKK